MTPEELEVVAAQSDARVAELRAEAKWCHIWIQRSRRRFVLMVVEFVVLLGCGFLLSHIVLAWIAFWVCAAWAARGAYRAYRGIWEWQERYEDVQAALPVQLAVQGMVVRIVEDTDDDPAGSGGEL